MEASKHMNDRGRALTGIWMVEMTNAVVGPSIEADLGDQGADVFELEPLKANNPRRLPDPDADGFPVTRGPTSAAFPWVWWA